MALGWGCNAADLPSLAPTAAERIAAAALKTRYYNAAIHQAAFALPQFMQDLLSDAQSEKS